MEFISILPIWALALVIFGLRICDVSLGTVRTIAVVQGLAYLAVPLGFLEVLIWVVAVAQVITRIDESLWLVLAYAGGYAAGNAVGILIERKLALGTVVVRMISSKAGESVANLLRGRKRRLTTFRGEGRDGPVTLIYTTCPRREVKELLEEARAADPTLFYAVEPVREWSGGMRRFPHYAIWNFPLKKK
ncbi:MAG: DUF2179 domain-containing protein [Bradymonadales bacterium]|nr:DUF2179 domain-containing protein [Bradymonadales bacterium]